MKVLLLQLPIPQLNFGRQTGNIPLGAACLAQAAERSFADTINVTVLSESIASYSGDSAIISHIVDEKPDIVGFTVYNWNLDRSLHIAGEIKNKLDVRIIFGGPEITADNPAIKSENIDFAVFGEGEALFVRLIENLSLFEEKQGTESCASLFKTAKSPYLSNLLDPHIENMMLLETQRGCPYRCGYCYYNKARSSVVAVDDELVIDAVRWAVELDIAEVFLLDPSLNARPGLKSFVDKIAKINKNRKISFLSEIRAEGIDKSLAESFADAGFAEFEIGLQSTNPKALKIMNRPTDTDRFLKGVKNLQEVGIRAKVDLIIGLPGDDIDGFKKSVDFVADHFMADHFMDGSDMNQQSICEDIQVFFLSVLPGTDFRKNSEKLKLKYDQRPPYAVIKTSDFNEEDMLQAFFYAEDRFDICLQPEPDLDLCYKSGKVFDSDSKTSGTKICKTEFYAPDIIKTHDDRPYIRRIVLDSDSRLPLFQIEEMAKRLTHPYQVFFMQGVKDVEYMCRVLEIVTKENPHTPFEVVFICPKFSFKAEVFEQAMKLDRPLYLDLDLPAYGSRSVLFTVATDETEPWFGGIMKRQVFYWKEDRLPTQDDFSKMGNLDGVLMDNQISVEQWQKWQDEFASKAFEIMPVTFADIRLQNRWFNLTTPDGYWKEMVTG
ncbi:B12-binding domain-containing radical SAM protein [Desulfobacterales bacterium HSG16]|nr:B12-binding domain-containing radical SAM protein [Desulfobacterales bacterium HSG16]